MRLLACSFRPRTRDSVADHAHACSEWHVVLAGRCAFHLAGRDLRLVPGDCFVIEAGVPHGIRMQHRDDWLLQYIIHSEDDADLRQAWQAASAGRGSVAIGAGRHAFFARLAADAGHGDRWRARSADHRFAALLCQALAGGAPPEVHPAVERALDLMRDHLRADLDLPRLAAHAGIDASYLSRLFNRDIGCPPLRYFMDMKLELAASLLRHGHDPVGAIAAAIGFHDPYHFSRRFSRWAGCAPSRYRGRYGLSASRQMKAPSSV